MNAPLVIGNWKMHGGQSECLALARAILQSLKKSAYRADVALAPPFTALGTVGNAIRRSKIKLAAQNCHWEERGAFTGEVSPLMIKELDCEFVIIGHSERRHIFGESEKMVARKLAAANSQGLRTILCVGETLDERRRKLTSKTITRQLHSALKGLAKDAIEKLEIAYEPVWAIGTGHNATTAQVDHVHQRIRKYLTTSFGSAKGNGVRILYGGSVKPENANELAALEEVNGLLVGGASLKAETFLPIVRSFN
jgi:triosephosphate isomerase